MANQVLLRLTMVMLVVILSSGWLSATTVKMEVERAPKVQGKICSLLRSVYQFVCVNTTTPCKVCKPFGTFLKDICEIPCEGVCVPPIMCRTPLPFEYCQVSLVCCSLPPPAETRPPVTPSQVEKGKVQDF